MKPRPTVLCRGWSPRTGVRYGCALPGSVLQEGEPGGETLAGYQCRICGEAEHRAWRAAAVRRDNAARRDRRQGKTYGPAPEGQDPFRPGGEK